MIRKNSGQISATVRIIVAYAIYLSWTVLRALMLDKKNSLEPSTFLYFNTLFVICAQTLILFKPLWHKPTHDHLTPNSCFSHENKNYESYLRSTVDFILFPTAYHICPSTNALRWQLWVSPFCVEKPKD